MKKFFMIVIAIAVLSIAGYGIAYLVSPVTSIELEEYVHEVGISCPDAFIVRNESVYYATSAGTVYDSTQEGDRVARDTVISTVYNGSVDTSVLRELQTIDNNISRLRRREAQSTLYSPDTASVESEIASRLNSIPDLADEDNVEQIHEYRDDINSLRAGEDISITAKIDELTAEKTSVENSISTGKSDILSDRAGIFSSYTDGLEAVLSPDRIGEYSVSYIRGLTPQNTRRQSGSSVLVGDPICKVMNNHVWYVLGIAGSSDSSLCQLDAEVMVRYSNLSGSSAPGRITYVSEPDENGEYLFLVEVSTFLESAFSYRNIDADIIFEEYSGYRVPSESIRTGDTLDSYYVYATVGSETYRCDCEVLYTDIDEGYSIIRSTEDAENKLGSMERLVVGER